MIPVDQFVDRMARHWITLGTPERPNVPTQKLRQVWAALGRALNDQVERVRAGVESWRVFPAEMGAGKTEGLKVWLSMLPREGHPGALVVIRQRVEADKFVDTLNDLAGDTIALSVHKGESAKDVYTKVGTFADYPVLAITHEAYERGLDALGQDTEYHRWPYLHAFAGRTRELIVIDETLDIVRENAATRADLDHLVAEIAPRVERQHPMAFKLVKAGAETLRAVEGNRAVGDAERELIAGVSGVEARAALLALANELDKHETLTGLVHVLDTWRWYFATENDASMHTARLLIPEGVTSALVLDATARLNRIYQEMSHRFEVIELEPARNFETVTIHDARVERTGKHMLRTEDVAKAMQSVAAHYGADARRRNVLAIITKEKAHFIEPWKHLFGNVETGTWGSLDGKNDYHLCTDVIVLSLLYRPDSVALNIYQAIHGPLNTEGLRQPPGVVQDIRESQITVDVAQGTNRIRCRDVVDGDGRCEPAAFWLRNPAREHLVDADRIMDGLRAVMPGVKDVPWLLGDETGARFQAKYDTVILARLGRLAPGERVRAADLRHELRVPQKTWTHLMNAIRKGTITLPEGVRLDDAKGGPVGATFVRGRSGNLATLPKRRIRGWRLG